jgi:hypothetical protein
MKTALSSAASALFSSFVIWFEVFGVEKKVCRAPFSQGCDISYESVTKCEDARHTCKFGAGCYNFSIAATYKTVYPVYRQRLGKGFVGDVAYLEFYGGYSG